MSMFKNRFIETSRKNVEAKADHIKEVSGLVPWGEVEETNPDDCLIPWGTAAEQEIANQALVNHFAR